MLVVVVLTAGGALHLAQALSEPAGTWRAEFPRGHDLITNEVAYREPDTPGVRTSPDWMVTSGSLFADDGGARTGPVDDGSPDVGSRSVTGSAVLRAVTVRDDFRDVQVVLDLRVEAMTVTDRTGRRDYDGVHLLLRYADPDQLYSVDLCRRDDTVTIKKKAPDPGDSDAASYHTLAQVPFDCTRGRWSTFSVRVGNEDGGVRLTLSTPEREVLSAVDDGAGGSPPLTGAGRVGVRGDNTAFRFRDLVICPAGERGSGAEAFCRAR
ncbi:hypothetical protein ACI782_24710 [Geodermatophilus sp. SYSU D00703]